MVGNVFVVSPSEDPSVLAVFCPVSSAVTIYFYYLLFGIIIIIQTSRTLISVGYDICFAVALVKTIRVAYIFWSVSGKKKVCIYTVTKICYYFSYACR